MSVIGNTLCDSSAKEKMGEKNKIVIYTVNYCRYCKRAKVLLDSIDARYQEIKVTNYKLLKEVFGITKRIVRLPQILIDGKHIGGFNELEELYNSGKLPNAS